MPRIRNISILMVLALVFSCIKPFDPEISGDEEEKYVVVGKVTDTGGWQDVKISLTSPIKNPSYIPVQGCQVEIHDDRGNIFSMEEYEPGSYHAWMDQQYLQTGTSYQVVVFTPDGSELQSSFDRMQTCPPLDSVYYNLVEIPTNDPSIDNIGLQFYVDLNAEGSQSRYYKWEVAETWEYHSHHVLEYYYDGEHHHLDPPDSSMFACWVSGVFPQIFTLSTKNFSSNTYHKFPLHFIDGTTSRLSVLYSILVRQMAISEEAYNYWDEMRVNSNQQGGLYEKQPLSIIGNIIDVTHPDQKVLGYFYAASESTRRYFYKDIDGLDLNFFDYCNEQPLRRGGWLSYGPRDYPVYYYYNIYYVPRTLDHECVDCRLRGGNTTKPDFWP